MANALLKISNSQVLHQFLHDCVDDFIGNKRVNFDNYTSDVEWTKDDYSSAILFIQNLYRQRVHSSSNEIFESKLHDLNPNIQECVKDCYEIRQNEIVQTVLKENLSKGGGRSLVENIDWKVKWVMGSSKLASLREPQLQLDLHCFKKLDENTRNTVNFEMNLEQVDKLISNLQNVKNELNDM